MFKCSKCSAKHSRYRNVLKTKPAAYCLACHAAHMRATRPKHRQLTPEQRKKANARAYANVYQRRGVLKPEPCQCCGAKKAQKHHEDYNWPLAIAWLCRSCHLAMHRGDVPRDDKPYIHQLTEDTSNRMNSNLLSASTSGTTVRETACAS